MMEQLSRFEEQFSAMTPVVYLDHCSAVADEIDSITDPKAQLVARTALGNLLKWFCYRQEYGDDIRKCLRTIDSCLGNRRHNSDGKPIGGAEEIG